ncbi:MAG: FtsX-like permease family protein [Kineosporiaceae bacterium]
MATWTWYRLDASRRWRSLLVLALLIAVAGATVLTAVAGARRGASALDRLTARTLPATVDVATFQPGFDWAAVRAMPEVEAMAVYAGTDFRVLEIPPGDLAVGYPPADEELMRSVERPVVFAGRLADPARIDEAVVTQKFVTTYHRGVGDTVTAVLPTPQEATGALTITGPLPSGPRITIRIVGVVRSPWLSDGPQSHGRLLPTPALLRTYRANLLNDYTWLDAVIRLHGGEAAIPAFTARLAAVTGRSDLWIQSQPEQWRHRQEAAIFEARWLLAFAVAAFVAATVLVGQALTRHVGLSLAQLPTLRALGMGRRQLVTAATLGPALAATVGGCLAVVAAVVASGWFPIGSAAADEPTPGADVDVLVLGAGFVVTVLLVVLGSAAAAWLTIVAVRRPAAPRPSSLAARVAAAGLPVPVVVGSRFALGRGRGTSSVPVRPALLGAVAGVLGTVAAFTFSAGVSEAVTNPARFGQTWQLETWLGFAGQDVAPAGVLRAAAADPDVVAVNDWRAAVASDVGRKLPFIVYSYAPVGPGIRVVLDSGRMPSAPSEVVLAPQTATALGARVGSSVGLTGTTGRTRALTVTGIGFVPPGSRCSGCSHASGAWVSDAGFDALFTTFQFHGGFVALRPGVSRQAVAERLQGTAPAPAGQDLFAEPYPPFAITQLRAVQAFPLALAAFLALLALAAVGHALASAVRRRRHDIAVLRALGMTPRQSRAVVQTQAAVLAAVGLLLGVPLGVAAGRTLWRAVAGYTPLQYEPPTAVLALLLVAPLTLVAALLLAAWPGRHAARLRLAPILRAE